MPSRLSESQDKSGLDPEGSIKVVVGDGDGKKMTVPRDLLIEKCDYFKTRLSDGWQEGSKGLIKLPEIRPKEMKVLINAFTKDELDLSDLKMKELVHFIAMATHMALDKFRDKAVEEMFNRPLTLGSVAAFYRFAKDLDYEKVCPTRKAEQEMERVENFVVEHGQEILKRRLDVLKELPETMVDNMLSKQKEELSKMNLGKLIALHRVAKRRKVPKVAEALEQAINDYKPHDVNDAIKLWKFINHSKHPEIEERLKQYLAQNANDIFRKKADSIIKMPDAMVQYLFSCESGVTLRESQLLKLAQSWYDNHPGKKKADFGPKGLKIHYSLLPMSYLEELKKTSRKAINPHLNDSKWFNSEYEKAKERRDPTKVLKNYAAASTGEFIIPVERVEVLGETVYTSRKLIIANLAWTLEIKSTVNEDDIQKQTFKVDLRCQEALYARSFNCEAVVVLTMVNHSDEKKSLIVREKKRFTDENEEARRLTKPLEETFARDQLKKEEAETEGWCIKDQFEFKVFLCINA